MEQHMSAQSLGTALVTGASSGIGAVYADRLARRGYDLILVARNRDRLNGLAAHITDATGRAVEVLPADLTDKAQLRKVEDVLARDAGITLLVNNAGFGATAPLLGADPDKMEEMIALNVTALTRLTYAAVPGMVQRGGGTIVNIASIVGIRPEVLNGVYGASKAFVLAFGDSLRHELAGNKIRVQSVLPGATATEFWPTAGSAVEHLPEQIVMSAEDMVDASLAGLDMGETVTIPALRDIGLWHRYEAARQGLDLSELSQQTPAPRYLGFSSAAE
jgi:short-subunit dehydrogenase